MELRFEKGIDLVTQQTQLGAGFARALVNFDVSQEGRLVKRTGSTLALNYPDCHSLWSTETGSMGYFVSNTTLYSYDGTAALAVVSGLTPGFRVSFAEVNDNVYWSNAVQSGRLVGGIANETWGAASTTGLLGQTYAAQVRGSIVRHYRGRIYVADGSILWATDPMDYMRVDLARGFIHFESEITLLEPVDNGIYVGTADRAVRFLSGVDFNQFQTIQADDLQPVRGSGITVDGEVFGLSGRAVVWFTRRGWVVGNSSGEVKWVTDKTLALPDYTEATSVIREQNGMRQIVSLARGGGSESGGASDILTSEVIRNGVLLI
jgi:hypothetical protein